MPISGYYGIILDETYDISTKEQISITPELFKKTFWLKSYFLDFIKLQLPPAICYTLLLRMYFYDFSFESRNVEDSAMMVQPMFLATSHVCAQRFFKKKVVQYTVCPLSRTNLILQSRMH